MTIYTMCVDAERGYYMAISADDSAVKAHGASALEALGALVEMAVKSCEALRVEHVEHIETEWKK